MDNLPLAIYFEISIQRMSYSSIDWISFLLLFFKQALCIRVGSILFLLQNLLYIRMLISLRKL